MPEAPGTLRGQEHAKKAGHCTSELDPLLDAIRTIRTIRTISDYKDYTSSNGFQLKIFVVSSPASAASGLGPSDSSRRMWTTWSPSSPSHVVKTYGVWSAHHATTLLMDDWMTIRPVYPPKFWWHKLAPLC